MSSNPEKEKMEWFRADVALNCGAVAGFVVRHECHAAALNAAIETAQGVFRGLVIQADGAHSVSPVTTPEDRGTATYYEQIHGDGARVTLKGINGNIPLTGTVSPLPSIW